jgi:hypothetical protein
MSRAKTNQNDKTPRKISTYVLEEAIIIMASLSGKGQPQQTERVRAVNAIACNEA